MPSSVYSAWPVLVAVALCALLAVPAESDEVSYRPLILKDQYGGTVELLADSEPAAITLVAFADREGAEGNRRWAAQLVDRYRDHLEGRAHPVLRVVPVAHLAKVPFFVRGMVKRGFRGREENGDRILPIALDWKGQVAEQLGFTPGVPNLALFDTDGRLREMVAADADEREAGRVFAALDDLLLGATRSAAR